MKVMSEEKESFIDWRQLIRRMCLSFSRPWSSPLQISVYVNYSSLLISRCTSLAPPFRLLFEKCSKRCKVREMWSGVSVRSSRRMDRRVKRRVRDARPSEHSIQQILRESINYGEWKEYVEARQTIQSPF